MIPDLTSGWQHILASRPGGDIDSAQNKAASRPQVVPRSGVPRLRFLSLGAGVQSTALLLLAAEGRIPSFDAAIFADTGWEPIEVYKHLDLIESQVARPAGIPVERVSYGNIRSDTLSRDYTISIPLYISNPNGETGMLSRQCTQNYKILPIYREVRKRLGAKEFERSCDKCQGSGRRIPPSQFSRHQPQVGECSVCRGSGRRVGVGPIPQSDAWISMAIGFSVDEIERVGPSRQRYVVNEYPLLDLGWTRSDAVQYLMSRGFGETPRSACVGCPYHSNSEWRRLKVHSPMEWADAVAFDEMIRHAPGGTNLTGEAFLHRDRIPLSLINSDAVDQEVGRGCSPFGCRSSTGIDPQVEAALVEADEIPSPY